MFRTLRAAFENRLWDWLTRASITFTVLLVWMAVLGVSVARTPGRATAMLTPSETSAPTLVAERFVDPTPTHAT